MRLCLLFALQVTPLVPLLWADGPADNLPDKVRPIPPRGIDVPPAVRAELEAETAALGKEIDGLRTALKDKARPLDLLPDVQVYHNAVRYALTYNEFHKAKELDVARSLLKQGRERAQLLREGKAPWETATGLVVRGYRSRIDDSVQPYGLVVPASYQSGTPYRHRLDAWFHGRGETLSELSFIDGRQRSPGEFTPPHAFVLHPYGRYGNANKFAGETDLFEALEHVKKHYPIDDDRIVVRGFSMGGAACWQFAVHYAGLWAAAAPGAGFAETAEFLRVFQNEPVKPTWYEQKLWHLYDCTDYALNLFNCPTVAYSGEIDRQKQAADVMARAMSEEWLELVHVIGPKTGHAYHPQAKQGINRRIDAIAAKGRDPLPENIRFTTWTLRYNRMNWITIDELGEHWERARVDAKIVLPPVVAQDGHVSVTTKNVTALTIDVPPGYWPFGHCRVYLDGKLVEGSLARSDRSVLLHYRLRKGEWRRVESPDDGTLRKRHGLQGPIDDAFMDRFVMVRPTGKPLHEKAGAWAAAEMTRAIDHWRRQFRGEARVLDDTAVTDAVIADSNLVLWGDPGSNHVLAKIADRLPIRWDREAIHIGDKSYPAGEHAAILIYPNPLNPRRYVVLNSGFTFRDYDYLNNARQVPKLPDYAVIDLRVPPSTRAPGKVVEAGFFDERWQLRAGK
jgi:pimeloyl-ACP methyl ester carboxylesterase